MAARSRYAEDQLQARVTEGLTQFVILGAGFDTFAYRNPYPNLHVFEIDHPATQELKRTQLTRAGIAIPSTLTYIPLNFETQTLADGLQAAGFNFEAPAFFSWLGVTLYLSRPSIQAVFQCVANLPRGSGLVFDYGVAPDTLTVRQRIAFNYMAERVAKAGEPWQTFFNPIDLDQTLQALGYSKIEDLDGPEINRRYFANRTDGLMVGSLARLLTALV
jgi:methyltransferase (TIGR00027 family)